MIAVQSRRDLDRPATNPVADLEANTRDPHDYYVSGGFQGNYPWV